MIEARQPRVVITAGLEQYLTPRSGGSGQIPHLQEKVTPPNSSSSGGGLQSKGESP